MPVKGLFPHQVEAVDAVLRVLQTPVDGNMPAEGLRTQVIAATGSGKTLIAVEAARNLGARRVLILVPTKVARGVRARRGSYPGSVASAGERTPPPGTRAERARGRNTAGRPVGRCPCPGRRCRVLPGSAQGRTSGGRFIGHRIAGPVRWPRTRACLRPVVVRGAQRSSRSRIASVISSGASSAM
ncbi:DEAD/DEAH box helicase family protein [Streptomyces mobaraensis]|uniref:Helicase/UvrB N-terminal domain-containing protein n=1 Tax=Streptomyces mobaraensis TaxID=35621 RepID=A0A5N5VYM8_STRMB|nr:DEAD/DEAH box helicase family protein [Streptomyces mobaraensis]KAB7832328.1 hypothetical protein FRZ00_34875 [Streptomyces mobaraensis]